MPGRAIRLSARAQNAWWMIRRGRFRLFLKSIVQELGNLPGAVGRGRQRQSSESRISAGSSHGGADSSAINPRFYNSRKVNPASFRPTVSVLLSDTQYEIDREQLATSLVRNREAIKTKSGLGE